MNKDDFLFCWKSRADILIIMWLTHLVDKWHPGFIDNNAIVLTFTIFIIGGIDIRCLLYRKKD